MARDSMSTSRALKISMAATVICMLPVHLTGVMAVELREQLVFSAAGLGAAAAAFRLSAALTSIYLGRLTDDFGSTTALRLGMAISALSAVGIGIFATSWPVLVAWLFFAGTSQALCQPAANRMLVRRIPLGRRGIAFGLKQAAPPIASMLAGVSVPIIAVNFGWRWTYAIVPVLAILAVGPLGRRRPSDASSNVVSTAETGPQPAKSTIYVLLVSYALGNSSSAVIPAFYVDAAVQAGTSTVFAGMMLAVGSLVAISVRLSLGLVADRMAGGHLRVCALLLLCGVVGLVLLAVGSPGVMAVGVVIALGGNWGINGVFWYAVMRAFPHSPGTITGRVAPGGMVGGILGPVAFGVLGDFANYRAAWAVAAAVSVLAAAAMWTASKRLAELSHP